MCRHNVAASFDAMRHRVCCEVSGGRGAHASSMIVLRIDTLDSGKLFAIGYHPMQRAGRSAAGCYMLLFSSQHANNIKLCSTAMYAWIART